MLISAERVLLGPAGERVDDGAVLLGGTTGCPAPRLDGRPDEDLASATLVVARRRPSRRGTP